MPKNKGRGGKNYRRGKNDNETKRELEFKTEGTEYAQVLKMLGGGRLECNCFDGVKRLGHIRGKLKKKVWIGVGDIILISTRDFQEDKCDVLHKYHLEEVKQLKENGEIPESTKVNENDTHVDITFEDDSDDEK
jgi:translation initiation factor 1A